MDRNAYAGCLLVIIVIAVLIIGAIVFTKLTGG
jgi:hypothetical protein